MYIVKGVTFATILLRNAKTVLGIAGVVTAATVLYVAVLNPYLSPSTLAVTVLGIAISVARQKKSDARLRREGRTWETHPPPRPWARSRVRFCPALGMPIRDSWRAPSCGYWHVRRSNRDGRSRNRTVSSSPGFA
jgi:hypothetical protein